MSKKAKTAITPTREENYPQWYQNVVRAADLAEVSPVRGCMVIRPWGYALWENMQAALDAMFKATGHENAYFPIFIPKSFLEKEAEHVEGFAKECAVVTHHRLEQGPEGGLVPAAPLEEPYVVRPTSETIIGHMFSRWIQSYRDLPILMNQWANVVRWELRPRLFLRTSEFLWQEGHTAHATAEEALEETRRMLGIYAEFAESYLAIPVISGEKTPEERFPGAVTTLTIEAMMQDRKALQAGTSHFLGQNFSRVQEIKFQSQEGREEYVWTTSWGASTRLVGALIMVHSDDDGLVLPPRVAPRHVEILPVLRKGADPSVVLDYCDALAAELGGLRHRDRPLMAHVDKRDLRGGDKVWEHIKKGVPIRVEIGPREVESETVDVSRRDEGPRERRSLPRGEFVASVVDVLDDIQDRLLERARSFRDEATREVTSLADFKDYFAAEGRGGFALCYAAQELPEEHRALLAEHALTPRCLPLESAEERGTCLFTGQPDARKVVFGRAY